MSVARVHTQKARKDRGQCEKCHDPIRAGDQYRRFAVGFRSHYEHRRCMKATCTPKTSELESSLLSEVYSAQEGAEGSLSGMRADVGDADDVQQVLQDVADAIREVGQQYHDQDEAFGGTGSTDAAERGDTLDSAADELESWSAPSDKPDDDERCDEHNVVEQDLPIEDANGTITTMDELAGAAEQCEACQQIRVDWWEETIDDAENALQSMELP